MIIGIVFDINKDQGLDSLSSRGDLVNELF